MVFDELGVERGLVDKHQPLQGAAHDGLAPGDPDLARAGHIRPLLLGGAQRFFYG